MEIFNISERFYLNNCRKIFNKFLESNIGFSDVTLMCNDGTCIKCHRFVLGACSPFFEKAFENYAQQKGSSEVEKIELVILLASYESKNVQKMVDYIYYGRLPEPDGDNVRHDFISEVFRVFDNILYFRASITTSCV